MKVQLAVKEKSTINGLDLSIRLLFISAIMNYEHPTKFRPLNLDPYDGTKDPVNHVQPFKSYIIFFGISKKMMCRSFPLKFRNAAWNWNSTLKPNSSNYFVKFAY